LAQHFVSEGRCQFCHKTASNVEHSVCRRFRLHLLQPALVVIEDADLMDPSNGSIGTWQRIMRAAGKGAWGVMAGPTAEK
jgi:hypothetical protein